MSSISIIIPVYNGEEFLEECLDSVLKQDIENKEIICVDDGSMDRTVEIIKKYQCEHSNIKLIMQKNQGAAIARNNALDIAQGDYIAFMDADDYYLDASCLRKLVTVCEQENVPICGSFRTSIRDGIEYPASTWREEFGEEENPKRFCYIDYQYDYNYQCYIFERSFLNRYGLRFPNLRRYQDPPFFSKAMWYAKEFMVAPVETYAYRLRLTPMKYSFIQMNDTLKGIISNLQFAKQNELWILYKNNLERLNKDFYRVLNENIKNGNMTALKYLIEIDEFVHDGGEIAKDFKLKVLEQIKEVLFENQYALHNRYQFPYEKIPFGNHVAIYGAGRVGKEIVKKIENMNYCSISVWVDKQYEVLQAQGIEVYHPEILLAKEFDCLVIAVEKEELFEEIKKEILLQGWDKNKVIIGPIQKNY